MAEAGKDALDDDLATEHALIIGDHGTGKLWIGVDLEDLDASVRNAVVDPSEIDLGKVEYVQQPLGVRVLDDIGPLLLYRLDSQSGLCRLTNPVYLYLGRLGAVAGAKREAAFVRGPAG